MSEFINFFHPNFCQNVIILFASLFIVKLWTVNCLNKLSKVFTDAYPSPSAIFNPMNPTPGLVLWFHESAGFGFRKSGLNKRNGFWNRFQFGLIKQGLIFNWTPRRKLHWNSNQNTKLFIHENAYKDVVCEMAAFFPGQDELTKKYIRIHTVSNSYNRVPLQRAPILDDITHNHCSDTEHNNSIISPKTGELWGVYCEDLG